MCTPAGEVQADLGAGEALVAACAQRCVRSGASVLLCIESWWAACWQNTRRCSLHTAGALRTCVGEDHQAHCEHPQDAGNHLQGVGALELHQACRHQQGSAAATGSVVAVVLHAVQPRSGCSPSARAT